MSDDKKPLDVQAIRVRANAATPGPWETEHDWTLEIHGSGRVIGKVMVSDQGFPDVEFIAHARADIPALCDEVEFLRSRLRDLGATIHEVGVLRERNAQLEKVAAEGRAVVAPHIEGLPLIESLHPLRDVLAELDTSTVSPPAVEKPWQRRCAHCNEIVEGIPYDFPTGLPVYCSRDHAEIVTAEHRYFPKEEK
jgi:hypothetical protein